MEVKQYHSRTGDAIFMLAKRFQQVDFFSMSYLTKEKMFVSLYFDVWMELYRLTMMTSTVWEPNREHGFS